MSITPNYVQPPADYALCKDVQFQFDSLIGLINTELATLAPIGATYVTLSTNSTLTNERVLTAGTAISLVDNGAGSTVVVNNIGVTSAIGTANQVSVSGATGAVTFSTPQNIHTGATPTFVSEMLTATSNQLILGTTRTVTLTAPTPASSSRTVTFPDLSGDYSVVGTIADQTIAGVKTFTSAPILSIATTNSTHLVLTGTTSGQESYLDFSDNTTASDTILCANRSYSTGVSKKTGQSAAWIFLETLNASSSIYFYTSATNNVTPSTRLTIDKNGLVTVHNAFTVQGTATFANGAVSTPSWNLGDSATGAYRTASNKIGIALNGVKAAEFYTSGTSHDVTYVPFLLTSGAGNSIFAVEKQTTSVTTAAKTIFSTIFGDGQLILVRGVTGTKQFLDIIACVYSTVAPTVVSSAVSGGPDTRTYTQSSTGIIQLQMGGGTYTVSATSLTLQNS